MSKLQCTTVEVPHAQDAFSLSRRAVGVDGVSIHYQLFNNGVDKPGLLFLHGVMAHSHWWDEIAPAFTDRFRVVAMDLSGMGDSDHRKTYTMAAMASDILTVIQDAELSSTTIVAHSFSSNPALHACAQQPDAIDRVVCIDSRLFVPGIRTVALEDRPDIKVGRKTYPSAEAATARYRLFNKGKVSPERLKYIAMQGLQQTDEGWTWKFDPSFDPEMVHDQDRWIPNHIMTPIDYIYGEESELDGKTMAGLLRRHLGNCGDPIAVRGLGHNMQLEEPDILIALLQGLFARPPVRGDQSS